MKLLIKTLFSIFFAIAVGVHVYDVYTNDSQPFWWHCIYFITYGTCWWMLFSENKNRSWIYLIMSLFPFTTHLYYAYLELPDLNKEFWICTLVCILLPLGFLWIHTSKNTEGIA